MPCCMSEHQVAKGRRESGYRLGSESKMKSLKIAGALIATLVASPAIATQSPSKASLHPPYSCVVGARMDHVPIEVLCGWNCDIAPDGMSAADMIAAGMDPDVAKAKWNNRAFEIPQWHRECDLRRRSVQPLAN